MNNEFMKTVADKIQGYCTRLDELHWSAPNRSVHKITDEYSEELGEFKDSLMENAQAMFGFIQPGELDPELPDAVEFEDFLTEVRGMLAAIKREAGDSIAWSGIINIVDDFFETTNKYIYLARLTKHQAEKER